MLVPQKQTEWLRQRDDRGNAAGRSWVAIMAATAQAQAGATREAQQPASRMQRPMGAQTAYKGRKPSYSRKRFESAQAMLGKSASVGEVARSTGLTRQTATASKMIRSAPRRPSPFGARERSRSRWTGTARASQTTLDKTRPVRVLHLDPIRRSTGPVHRAA